MTRFWSKVEKTNNCWNWTAASTPLGYGRFSSQGKLVYAHRYSYELFKDDIPDGLELDHLCRNPSCVNPDHLDVITHKENMNRGVGPSALNSRKTHCPRDHPYNGISS